jgi:beta-glucosidase
VDNPWNLPSDFVFGASTASYQIEGAATEGGRGPSIWDTFCAEPGRIADGSSGAEACDHYHRYPEDVGLLKGLGVQGYRFSIAWPRIQPEGSGRVNPEGLAFYDRLLDELLAAGIEPMATLYHWDLPQPLQDDRGGWLNRETAERFGEYAALCGMRFGDRVRQWVPVNEPNVAGLLGYALGRMAPGETLMFEALPAVHHLLLGHGRAVAALRATGAREVGTATNHSPMWPASQEPADLAATEMADTLWNRLFADPILLGRYPEGFAELMPGPVGDDLAAIGVPLEFYGLNYYNPMSVAAPAVGDAMPFEYRDLEGYPKTDFDWPVVPDAFRECLVTLKQRYPDLPPIYITENGCSCGTAPDADGVVDDQPRIDYLDGHLRAVARARAEGVDVRGYFTWSLLDNFEWAEGYTQRFVVRCCVA